jgi:hypothetical protein
VTVKYLGGNSERRNREFSGPVPTYTADFISGGSLPSGMTFTRATTASYYSSAGLITTAATNTPRFDYDPGNLAQQNLDTNSQNLATHTVTNAFVIPAPAIQAPDGTYTAYKYYEDTANSGHNVFTAGGNSVIGVRYNFSFYLKSAGQSRTVAVQGIGTGAQGYIPVFDPDTGLVGGTPPPGTTMTPVGNGWYRCQFSITATVANSFYLFLDANSSTTYQGDGFSGVFIWGFQVCEGSTVLPYLPTNGAAKTICQPKGLLLEQASTNLCFPSNDWTNAAWVKTGSSITANVTISPDGTVNATKLVEDTSTGVHRTFEILTTVASTAYTFSCYLRAAEYSSAVLSMSDGSTGDANGLFTLTGAGTAAAGPLSVGSWTNISYGISYVGGGWYRCLVTGTHAAGTVTNATIHLYNGGTSYTGNGTNGIYVYGAQTEATSFATSYIPTTSVAVTRNADDARITGFSSWFSQSAGTFVVQYDYGWNGNSPSAFSVNPAGGFNVFSSNGAAQWWNGTTNVVTTNTGPVNTLRKEAFSYTASSRSLCLNAGPVASDANVPFSGTVVAMFLGDAYSTGQWINGHIRSFNYYPATFTATQLQAATSVSVPAPAYAYNFGTGVLDPSITFSRSSIGTYYNQSGYLTTAANDTPRFDYDAANPSRQNLEPYNQLLGSPYRNLFNSQSVSAPSVAAPDGTYTAWFFSENTVNNYHQITGIFNSTVGQTYTFSCYVKSAGMGRSLGVAGMGLLAAAYNPYMNPDNGALGGSLPPGTTFQNAGNGWYRLIVPFTATSVSPFSLTVVVSAGGAFSYAGDGASGIYIWGMQVNQGSTALPYLATGATALTICPIKGLLVEQSSTNLITNSAFVTGWGAIASTISNNTTISPEGVYTGTTITASVSATAHAITGPNASFTSGTTYTYSIYLKYATNQFVQLPIASTVLTTNAYANFDLINGTITASSGLVSSSLVAVGYGWYRATLVFTANATSVAPAAYVFLVNSGTATFAPSFTATGSESVAVYGPQMEASQCGNVLHSDFNSRSDSQCRRSNSDIWKLVQRQRRYLGRSGRCWFAY